MTPFDIAKRQILKNNQRLLILLVAIRIKAERRVDVEQGQDIAIKVHLIEVNEFHIGSEAIISAFDDHARRKLERSTGIVIGHGGAYLP